MSLGDISGVWGDSLALTPVDRLAEVSLAHPDKHAIVETGPVSRAVTYREFDDSVAEVAAAVTKRTRQGDRVGILTDDTIDHLTALFGIQRAGRIAVPLDGGNPLGRLQYIVEHAGVSLILVTSGDAATGIGPDMVVLEVGETRSEAPPPDRTSLEPSTPAQIVYTSGSTGSPKGVVQSHAYLLSRFQGESAMYDLGADDRLSQFFPISFAASNGHSFGALVNGATLFPYDIGERGIHHLSAWVDEHRLTGLAMVPTLFRRAFAGLRMGKLDSVRFVMVGGEVALAGDLELFNRCFAEGALFIHRLASTETGSIAYYIAQRGSEPPGPVLPAGRPAPGKTISIVDGAGSPVADGEVGELVVTGRLSDGYWNASDLTGKVFLDGPGANRTYRTGDLARFEEGNLVHQGRKDGRIKVRGFGVDLLEVERALLEMPGIEEGAIRAFEDEESGHVLIGYFVASLPVDTQALRSRFRERVPEYMVPTDLVQMDAMPLTDRGKIDRSRLTRPEAAEMTMQEAGPLSGLEQTVHDLWASVLGRETVDVDQSFFDLGGNSVGAYELIGKIYSEMGVDLPASSLLSAPTIREQVQVIERGFADRTPTVVPLRSGGKQPAVFGIHGRGGGIVYLHKLSDHLDARFALYGVQPQTFAGEAPPMLSVEEIAGQYVEELKRAQPEDPYLLVGSCFGGLVAWEMARMLDDAGDEIALLALVDPPRPGTEHGERPPVGWERIRRRARKKVRVAASRIRRRAQGDGSPDYGPRYRALSEMHSAARKAYQPRHSDVPLLVLAAKGKVADQEAVWREVANGGLEVEEYPVVHAETWTPWNRKVIAEMLNARLREVEFRPPRPGE